MTTLAFVLLLMTGIDTSLFPKGQAQVFQFDSAVKVTITRDGDARNVMFERGNITNRFRLEPVGGQLQVTHSDVSEGVIPYHVVVDGVVVGVVTPAPSANARYYICPKDETMVRLGKTAAPAQLLCPVDGTPMKSSAGRDNRYFLLH